MVCAIVDPIFVDVIKNILQLGLLRTLSTFSTRIHLRHYWYQYQYQWQSSPTWWQWGEGEMVGMNQKILVQ